MGTGAAGVPLVKDSWEYSRRTVEGPVAGLVKGLEGLVAGLVEGLAKGLVKDPWDDSG